MLPKLITQEQLQVRYKAFAAKDGELFSKRALYRWRKEEEYPPPVISSPRLVWLESDVIEWEKKKNYTFLHSTTSH
ncbi:hypothetical protein LZS85_15765 [Aliivibrio fischeri]|uniref:helix-turn-helix transcriptional regulator n=1 Tax=Aliivibrio fischeri TaxID=668 RepID=UPI001F34B474|nr:hypothetical protein [Aliivibrio fischeri]MCE7567581.1 hypothetical protein [Aliivibrio fischeri]